MRAAGVFCLAVLVVTGTGCGGKRQVAYPAPTYERSELPDWNPPRESEQDEDLTSQLAEMEGDWVSETEDEEPTEGGRPEAGATPEAGASDDPTFSPESPDPREKEPQSGEDDPEPAVHPPLHHE